MASRKFMLIFTLAAIPLLGGSKCAFFFSSGGGSSDREKDKVDDQLIVAASESSSDSRIENDPLIVAASGNFSDPPAEGVSYESGSLSGVTGKEGEFRYEPGNTIRFFIGDVSFGGAVNGKSIITPQDLVVDGTIDTPAVVNITRLLRSLDSDPGDEVVTIPETVRVAAVKSNEELSSAIEFLDFSDNPAFVNAASQLVAVLTHDYPFTAKLVDPEITGSQCGERQRACPACSNC